MQADDSGDLHAVSYGAQATTAFQANYTADDSEACVLMYALKSIEELAIHKRITVITDNAHLLHLATWHPINARQRRMLSYLMQYNLSIRFIKGSRNLLADAMSRLFQDSSKHERKDHETKYMHDIDDFILPVTTRSASRKLELENQSRTLPSSASDGQDLLPDHEAPGNVVPTFSTDSQYMESNIDVPVDFLNLPSSTLGNATDQSPLDPLTENDDSNDAPIDFPKIGADDYRTDDEFCNIYTYLQTDELTGNARKDKTTSLMSDRFVIENDLLYRIVMPRQKRLAQLRPVVKRSCIPKRYRHNIIRFVHNNCGHYAVQSMYHTLFGRY